MSAPKYQYVTSERDAQGRLLAKGTLKHGLTLNGVTHKEFVMREPVTGDLLDAEQEASTAQAMTYNTALMCRTLERVGEFEGAITMSMLRSLKTGDFAILRAAQAELDLAGEIEQ